MATAVLRGQRKYGKSGLATIKKHGGEFHITFKEDNQKIVVEEGDALDDMREGEAYVTMDEHNIGVAAIRPAGKAYYGKFIGFYAKEGELPNWRLIPYSPKTQKRTWDIPEHLEATALFKIEGDKQWDGFTIGKSIVYCFVNYDNSGEVALMGYGSKKTEEFMTELGYDFMKDTLPYSDNILPVLQDTLLERGVKLLLQMRNGWIQDIIAAP